MDYPKFFISNQKEESISIQRVNLQSLWWMKSKLMAHNWITEDGLYHFQFIYSPLTKQLIVHIFSLHFYVHNNFHAIIFFHVSLMADLCCNFFVTWGYHVPRPFSKNISVSATRERVAFSIGHTERLESLWGPCRKGLVKIICASKSRFWKSDVSARIRQVREA